MTEYPMQSAGPLPIPHQFMAEKPNANDLSGMLSALFPKRFGISFLS